MLLAWSALPLRPSDVHVWRASLQASPSILAQCRDLLSEDERARAKRFRFPEHERRYVVVHGVLRQLLAGYVVAGDAASLSFAHGPAGKPRLESGNIQFNLSHSGDWALMAISHETVGVDLEQIRTLEYESVGRQVFTQDALDKIAIAPDAQKPEIFCRFWVRREAQLKALGLGIGDARHLEIPVHDLPAHLGYCAALATAIANPTIELHEAKLV